LLLRFIAFAVLRWRPARFLSRKRHEGHLDHLKTNADVLVSFQQQAALGALGIARAITVNTEGPVEMSRLIAGITAALELSLRNRGV
jgi:hypothetical protein